MLSRTTVAERHLALSTGDYARIKNDAHNPFRTRATVLRPATRREILVRRLIGWLQQYA